MYGLRNFSIVLLVALVALFAFSGVEAHRPLRRDHSVLARSASASVDVQVTEVKVDVDVKDPAGSMEKLFCELKSSVSAPLSEIQGLVSSNKCAASDLSQAISEIDCAIKKVLSGVQELSKEHASCAVSQISQATKDELKKALEDVLCELRSTLDKVLGANVPGIGPVLSPLIADVNEVFCTLDTVINGALELVSDVLCDISKTLSGLGLGGPIAELNSLIGL